MLVVAGCAGYAALVLSTASWGEAAALRTFYDWHPRAYTQAEFRALRLALSAAAAVASLLGAALGLASAGRAEWRVLGTEVRLVGHALRASWQELRPGQRRLAGTLLLGLTVLRLSYSLLAQPFDELTSYELFVRERLLQVSACYPIPNNHVLANTLAWGFYQVYPGFWWSIRLPVLLVSTGATALWFLALLWRSNFRIALLAVSLFSMLPNSLCYAAEGRGYWLLVALGVGGFLAVLRLQEGLGEAGPQRGGRLAWAGLVISGLLGLYTVPTHSYFLASAYSWLAVQALRHRAGRWLGYLVGAGLLTGLGAGLLYAPLLWLSGPELLLHNPYVVALPPGEFWPAVLETVRYPHHLLGILCGVVVLGGFWQLRQWARAGKLPTGPGRLVRQVGGPCVWFVGLPYLMALGQQVLPPERTLFYKDLYFLVLISLGLDWSWQGAWSPLARRRLQGALLGAGLLLVPVQLWRVSRQELAWRGNFPWHLAAPGVNWLAAQPPGPVLAPDFTQRLLLRFYAHTAHRDRAWQIDELPRPGVHYRYLVSEPGAHAVPGAPAIVGGPIFHNGLLDVFEAP